MEPVLKAEGLSKTYKPFLRRAAEILRLRSLAARYDDKIVRAVDGVSLEIGAGEIAGLIGPNGAGKTTFLKLITGLVSPDSGDAFINGRSVTTDRVEALKSVGGIIEAPAMYKNLSGRENLRYLADLQGGVPKERIEALAELFKLKPRLDDKYQTYSLGMKQRLGIIQAIMHRPRLLILDEPTNGLDPEGIMEMRDTLRELAREENMAILVSSHMLSEIEEICDKVAIIGGGKLLKVGTVASLSDGINTLGRVKFTCDDASKAAEIAAKMGLNYEIDAAVLTIDCKEEQAAEITKELVLGGISVFGVNVEKANLEKAFRQITSEERDK